MSLIIFLSSLAYPDPDPSVHTYMGYPAQENVVRLRYHTFLKCLCQSASAELRSLFRGPKISQAEFATHWREHLAKKDVRAKFYAAVVTQAAQETVRCSVFSHRCTWLSS